MTAALLPLRYRFGRFELHPNKRLLLTSGGPVDVGSRAFDLLVVLAERDGHLGVPTGTVMSRLSRARERLRRMAGAPPSPR